MESTLENVYLNIPKADLKLVKELAKKMGWKVETKDTLLKKYISSRPKRVDLTDDEIMAEIIR
ncbi:hypothetical protein LJC05_01460 [Bacteroides sp. OttesenSCG-928-J23]|nr:hypothetical protein [Bacteroides sp. OttesenSCG-928-J23]MDL2299564.1 hypothetical protein [Bacteroides sp. OttesenSCG-928-E20]MDL2305023.1 hypothetical protein [Bacteroides sp. OttesenSCG-928-D19]